MKIYQSLFSSEFCDSLIPLIKNECVLSEAHHRPTNWFTWLIWGSPDRYEFGQLPKEKWNDNILNLVNNELSKTDFDIETKKLMWLQMTEYKDGRSLRRHRDSGTKQTAIVVLSNGFVGGDTFIWDPMVADDRKIELNKGDGVLFNGHKQYHEIKSVTEGTRYALNFWFI